MVVLDFGGQTAQLIARRVREMEVYSELLPHDTPLAEILGRHPRAIILSGGPASVYDADAPRADPLLWSAGIPILGICYGVQLMAHELGGEVLPATHREYGPATVTITEDDGLFKDVPREQPVWMSHGDLIARPPMGFRPTALTASSPYAGLADPERRLYGIQFHPEVVHTPAGRDILRNFVFGIAGARPNWTTSDFIASTVAGIRARVDAHAAATGSEGRVICALSGGRRFGRRGGARAPRRGRSTDLHLRGPRADAQEGVGAAAGDLRGPSWHAPGDGRRTTALPRPAGRRGGPGGQAAHHRRRVHPRLRGGGGPPGADRLPDPGHALPRRHRVDRARRRRPPRRSRPTTTWGACRRTSASSSSSRCATSSRTRCARWASNWACPRPWSSGSRSPAPAWPSASSAR